MHLSAPNLCTDHDLTNLTESDLANVESLEGSDFSGSNFSGSNLSGLGGDFESHLNLSHAFLTNTSMERVKIELVDFTESQMFGVNLTAAVGGALFTRTELERANLSGAELRFADFREADLNDANLSGANLFKAYLSGANLLFSDFTGANLTETEMIDVTLQGANFQKANLSGAELTSHEDETAFFCEATMPNSRSGRCPGPSPVP